MAQQTLRPDQDQDKNPGQDYANELSQMFDDQGNLRTVKERIASREGAIDQAKSRLEREQNVPEVTANTGVAGLRQGETAAPQWRTNINQKSQDSQQSGSPLQLFMKARKKWIIGGSIITLITGLFGGGGLNLLQFANLNQTFNDKSLRIMNKGMSHRQLRQKQVRYFSNPDDCQGARIKCRFHRGLSDNEIKRLRDAGLRPEIATSAGGKKYIKSFTTTSLSGKDVVVTGDNFLTEATRNPHLLVSLHNVAKPRSILTMGAETLKKALRFRINMTNPIGDGRTTKEMEVAMRKTLYSENNLNGKFSLDEDQDRAVKDEAQKLLPEDFEKPVIPSMDLGDVDLSEVNAANAVKDAASGGLKGAIMGVAAVPDRVCAAYDIVRRVDILAKIYKSRALIKYAYLFMTLGSKFKAGDISAEEINFALGILMSLSVVESSRNKNFYHSEGWTLMAQNVISNPTAIAKYTNGGSGAPTINTVRRTIEALANDVGVNLRRDCGFVTSFWGQLVLGGLGILIGIGTFGTAQVLGIVTSAALSTTIGILEDFYIPMLAFMAAGTFAPDPKDPQGGYGAGNALAAGWQAFGGEIGRSNGMRPLPLSKYKQEVAEATDLDNRLAAVERKNQNPFDITNPYSITSKVATALMPYTSSPAYTAQQGVMAALSPLTLLQKATLPGVMANPALAANEDPYGSQHCADQDTRELGFATDAFCNVLYYEESQRIYSPTYHPDTVSAYMVDRGHADPETGGAISEEFKNFKADCVNDQIPLLGDGGGVSVDENENSNGGTINTKQCYSEEEMHSMFRFYIMDTAIYKGDEQGSNGTFGKDSNIVDEDALPPTGGTTDTGDGGTGSNLNIQACNNKATIPFEDNIRILCEALKYDPYKYEFGAGHCGGDADSAAGWIRRFKARQLNFEDGILDCSSIIRMSIYEAYKVDVGCDNVTRTMPNRPQFYTRISQQDAKAGDIIVNSHHTGIVISNDTARRRFTAFNAYGDNGVPAEDQIGKNNFSYGNMPIVLRYTGPKNR